MVVIGQIAKPDEIASKVGLDFIMPIGVFSNAAGAVSWREFAAIALIMLLI